MKVCIVIYSNDTEMVWNAFRLAITYQNNKNDVSGFLLGKGVEASIISTLQYDTKEKMEEAYK